ncbi:hypothetical protein AGMMS49938_09920 [Fibrobacterales bacterium]|nr:hypothetical protein AGMMS49938_09920 [Fibrobacterales bacterium]
MQYFLLLLSAFLLVACGGSRKEYSATDYSHTAPSEGVFDDGYAEGGSGRVGDMLGGLMGSSGGSIRATARTSVLANSSAKQINTMSRLVNYDGRISLQVAEPESVIDTVVKNAAAKGGSVGNRRNGFVSLQIPVGEFKAFFNWVLTLGFVADKSISATDITEQYTDNDTQLRIAQTTLTRLQQLLSAAKTEQEKLALLKDIQRVSEQIEQKKIREKELLRQANFSTLSLSVSNIPRQIKPLPTRKIEAFEWLNNLLDKNICACQSSISPLKLTPPKDFIETEDSKKSWSAASALNAEFWAFKRKNNPQGTADFWANAILNHFKNEYSAELTKNENYSLIRLQTATDIPEIYYIAILNKTDKKYLRIAEAYFPNLEAENKHGQSVKETLGGVR